LSQWLQALTIFLATTASASPEASQAGPATTMDPTLTWLGIVGALALVLLGLNKALGKGIPELPDEAEGDEGAEAKPETQPEPEPDARRSWGLAKTRKDGFIARLGNLLKARETIDTAFLDELEELLVRADIGVKTTGKLIDEIRANAAAGGAAADPSALWGFLRSRSREILDLPARTRPTGGKGPRVVLVVGVNGTGKTTTIGKLAHLFTRDGERVLLAAGDTFRAAAAEQLEVWAERTGTEVVRAAKDGADPSSVVFEAIERATAEGHDVVIADTAGRLHTKMPLMQELIKIHRVCGKARAGAPHEVLLVLDATNGQNAILQAREFHQATELTGIVLSKLDGTAKGGVVLGICDEFGIPVRFVGVGEQAEDLRRFEAEEFVEALFTGA
jgi:fused signal recognition particle receptor